MQPLPPETPQNNPLTLNFSSGTIGGMTTQTVVISVNNVVSTIPGLDTTQYYVSVEGKQVAVFYSWSKVIDWLDRSGAANDCIIKVTA